MPEFMGNADPEPYGKFIVVFIVFDFVGCNHLMQKKDVLFYIDDTAAIRRPCDAEKAVIRQLMYIEKGAEIRVLVFDGDIAQPQIIVFAVINEHEPVERSEG